MDLSLGSVLERGAEGFRRRTEGATLIKPMWHMARHIEGETDHSLLDYSPEKLASLDRIDAIVVVGPSGAGKSTLVDVARTYIGAPELAGANFVVPKRIVSRPQRANDNLLENDFAKSLDEFREKVGGGILWRRKMDQKKEGGRIEWYGFEKPEKGTLPIYSANLDFFSAESELSNLPPEFFKHTLVVYVYALPHIRGDRLNERSPDIMTTRPEEAAKRLAGDTEFAWQKAQIKIRTRSLDRERDIAGEVMLLIMGAIAEAKKGK